MKLSNEQKEYIRNNYRSMKTKQIANNLNLEYKTVKYFCRKRTFKKRLC